MTVIIVALSPLVADAQPLCHRVEFGGGFAVPFQEDNRTAYGAAPVFHLGYAARFAKQGWVVVESGLQTSGGDLIDDPTFEVNTRYWLLPVGFGLRGNAGEPGQRVQLGLGLMFQSVWTWFENPRGQISSEPSFGVALDLRPEIMLNERWGLWLRQRLVLLSASAKDKSGLNHSSGQTEIGLSFGGT